MYVQINVTQIKQISTLSQINVQSQQQYTEADSEGDAGGAPSPPPFFFAITCFFCSHFEELQTVLFEVEMIINNAPLTCIYPNTIESCLTTNHLLFDR